MSQSDASNILTLFEFPADSPEKEPVIETLLDVLEAVRFGRLCSVALVGVSEDGRVTSLYGTGVRVDQTPIILGLLELLSDELKYSYHEAFSESEDSADS